jgi:hypothetical protein
VGGCAPPELARALVRVSALALAEPGAGGPRAG